VSEGSTVSGARFLGLKASRVPAISLAPPIPSLMCPEESKPVFMEITSGKANLTAFTPLG